ncbi:MAG: HlyD family type I secretion periplasmic adaptor subunit [Gammaproteobacteria bacterium]|nr:HlyD family type I secretion periplasmic adaptor subunit [Gammaproteobacteria bacterium]
MRQDRETDFLPAVLEIQERPPSPMGRAVLWVIVACFCAALCWAVLGEVDVVATAQGRIIASGHSKYIQPLEIGTVTAIHVGEGQQVVVGDVLIELDPTGAKADVDRLVHERDLAARDVGRMRTLSSWLTRSGSGNPDPQALATDPLLQREWQEFRDRVAVIEAQRAQQQAARLTALRQVDKLDAVLPIVTRRASDFRRLVEKDAIAEQQYLATEQERLETLHDLRSQRQRADEVDAIVTTLDARITATRSEFRRQALERRESAERQLAAVEQELTKARARLDARVITAPVAGTVQQLDVHNVGAVVTPAQKLMVIVPTDEPLEVEATLENKDVGFVAAGQRVEIKVDTFPFTKYGAIGGRVLNVSGDAVFDDHKGLVYGIRATLERTHVTVNGAPVALVPGMTVTVEAKTGTRRLIEFFLSPLLRYRNEALRER